MNKPFLIDFLPASTEIERSNRPISLYRMSCSQSCHMCGCYMPFLFKLLISKLDSVLQRHRFEIVEEIGCLSSPTPYGLSLLLISFPAALSALISLVPYLRACLDDGFPGITLLMESRGY